jgi:SAM-dependent methyltransferase
MDESMRQHDDPRSPHVDAAADVQRFYEAYPYPPPVESLERYRLLWQDPQRRRADFHLFWPSQPFREEFSVLVAGCGTSQAAKHAMRWPRAQVIGIDFSATSVRSTQALKRKYKLNNLEVRQLPVERAIELGKTFDQVVCTGVLHHLPDPDAGLRALHDVLTPGGVMQLMVYAPYGRAGIYIMQDFCRRVGIRANDPDIRSLVTTLQALPPGHPMEKLLREAPDFQQEAALADALLHPQDRAYSVPQLFEFIERAGLTFGRWLRQAPYTPRCGALAQLPQARRMIQLPAVEQYAAVELFRGTMVRHSAIVHRSDGPEAHEVCFSDEVWTGYVPVRTVDTVCVQERLPPGAAAVLINRSHTFRDLYLPIDATEKGWFDAIDGNRTIGEIVQRLPSPGSEAQLDAARNFFERLWWYDQVVFYFG